MSRQLSYALGITLLALGGIVYTLVSGNHPLLGLDLQGGVSVVLEPASGQTVDNAALNEAVDIIRNRVDGLGVAEPNITRDGQTILVQIPGVKDTARALDLVGQTAELRFRPVLAVENPALVAAAQEMIDGKIAKSATETDAQFAARVAAAQVLVDKWTATPSATADQPAVLAGSSGGGSEMLRLGPAPLIKNQADHPGKRLTGDSLQTANAQFSGTEWVVRPTFRSGSPGIDDFNALATKCFNRVADTLNSDGSVAEYGCPTGRIAIEIDGRVKSAPNVQVATFQRDSITISGSFDESSAKDLALVLKFGALPVELVAEQSQVVSSTLGSDALRAGVVSGLIGLALVAMYLIAYYRLMGIIAILSLGISGSMLWTIIAYLGSTRGLALTLAGVTGLIVSVGLSVDSNVVYFENLKEDVRGGRTIRSAVDRAFPIAYSTIVKADIASLIAAGVLYFLTVGSVKGFALYLGLATILDLIATYFFMGPMVRLLAAKIGLYEHQSRFGIPNYEEAES